MEKFVINTDKDLKDARNILLGFASSYALNGEQKPNLGWAKIREYKALDTGLLFNDDKIAPGSIVVKHIYHEDNDGNLLGQDAGYFWISGKRGKFGEPLIYTINGDGVQEIPDTHVVTALNRNWDTIDEIKYMNQVLFISKQDNGIRTEIEIWKKGKSMPEKKREKEKVGKPRLDLLQPAPQPV